MTPRSCRDHRFQPSPPGLLLAAVGLCLALLSCQGDSPGPGSSHAGTPNAGTANTGTPTAGTADTVGRGGKPPIVIISIDTLRADRLPAYGYDAVETPHIDGLRRDGILFRHAYSHIPLTLPSHTSLFTGQLPPAHGIRDNIGYRLDPDRLASGDIPYLPSLLKAQGYATGAAVSTYVLRSKMGLDVDFDFYEDSIEFRPGIGLGGMQRDGAETLALAKPWLSQAAAGPFFFFFHIYEPHSPYTPPSPYAERYDAPYDGEVAYADHIIGSLLDELRRLGVYDDALIILLSDHGEGLGDHGEDEHGILLYETTLRVPLIVKLPASQLAGESVDTSAQLIDVLPTVVDLLQIEGPPTKADTPDHRGMSLLALRSADAPRRRIYAESFYPRLHFGWSDLASLIDGHHHYIEGPDPEVYDLLQDPTELHNVIRQERRLFAELRDELATYNRTLVAPGEVDEESRQALAALGYMGSSGDLVEGPLADPKSRLDSLTDLKDAFRLHAQKQDAEAVLAFDRALADNPRMLDAWEFKARSLERLGRREEALEAYRKALDISGGGGHLAVSAASLFFDLGRFEEADAHARLALDSHSSFAHGLLARIAFEGGDLDAAEREARLALDEKRPRLGPKVTLAAVLHGKGQLEDALAMAEGIAEEFAERKSQDPELIQGLHLVRGKILADLGRPQEATAAFDQEILYFPQDFRAYANLALLYGLTGQTDGVTPTLRRMVDANPSAESYAEAVKTLRLLGYNPGADALLRHARALHPESMVLRDL